MARLTDSYEFEFYYGATHETKDRAAELRKNMTKAEKRLWKYLRNRQVQNLKFRRQHPVSFFILDFYCHECKLAIEVDGKIHQQDEQREWDENRSFELNELGIHVLRFTNEEVMNSVLTVVKRIEEFLLKPT